MYEIRAKTIAERINISRGGKRARRLPSIVLGTGAVPRISPGRSVRVTESVYRANKYALDMLEGVVEVIDRRTSPLPRLFLLNSPLRLNLLSNQKCLL